MVNSAVLVLNQNYLPLNVCTARRAIVLLLQQKAEMVENGAGYIHTINSLVPLPSVIRLVYIVKRPNSHKKLTRLEIFARDHFRCQYCGKETRNLTLDHIMPRFRGGPHTWENVVSACIPCNRKKAGKTPLEAGMKLIRKPFLPKYNGYYIPYQYLRSHDNWLKFIPQ